MWNICKSCRWFCSLLEKNWRTPFYKRFFGNHPPPSQYRKTSGSPLHFLLHPSPSPYLMPVPYTKASLSILIRHACSRTREIETNDSMIIISFPSLMSILNQSIVNQNYIENEHFVSTVRATSFRIYSSLSCGRSIPFIQLFVDHFLCKKTTFFSKFFL